MGVKLTVLLGIGVAIAYFLYVPFPENCDYPFKLKAMASAVKVVDAVGGLWVELGGSYSDVFNALEPKRTGSTDTVDVIWTKFGDVEVGIFKPKGYDKNAPGAAMVYYHGGGFTVGSVALYARFILRIVENTGMLIVSPNYRLAPEHPFPASFDDSLKVTQEFMSRANEFNVNPDKIVLSGDSAGGNLAVAIGLEIGKLDVENSASICMINSIYPVLQSGNFNLPAYLQNSHAPILPSSLMARFILNYMGYGNLTELIPLITRNIHMNGFDDADMLDRMSEKWIPEKYKQRSYTKEKYPELTIEELKPLFPRIKQIQNFVTDVRFSPLMATDDQLRRLPKTHVITCEYDPLRDDGIILYERMKSLKLKASHQHLNFAAHGAVASYGQAKYEKLEKAVEEMYKIIKESTDKCGS